MKTKEGQATLFIMLIVVVLVFVSVVIFFVVQNDAENTGSDTLTQNFDFFVQAKGINDYVERCLKLTAYEGMIKLGEHGGYIHIPSNLNHSDKAYWYADDINLQPLFADVQQELIQYVNATIKNCTNFTFFEEKGFDITTGDADVDITIGKDDLTVDAFFPVYVKQQEYETHFDSYSANFGLRFRHIWELGSSITNSFMDPYFDFSDPLATIDTGDLNVDFDSKDGHLIFKINDSNNYVMGRNNYSFYFVYKKGDSNLVRRIALDDNNGLGSTNPEILYSVDRDAHLAVPEGSTFSHDEISVQTNYGTLQVQQQQTDICNNGYTCNQNYNWKLFTPIYSYGPDNFLSSQPMSLNIYYPETTSENIGIIGNHDGSWHALDSEAYDDFVSAQINGFSEYAAIDCDEQDLRAGLSIFESTIESRIIDNILMPLYIFLGTDDTEAEKRCIAFIPSCDQDVVIFESFYGVQRGECSLLPDNPEEVIPQLAFEDAGSITDTPAFFSDAKAKADANYDAYVSSFTTNTRNSFQATTLNLQAGHTYKLCSTADRCIWQSGSRLTRCATACGVFYR